MVFFVYFSSLRIFLQYILFIFNHFNIPLSFLFKFLVMSPVCAVHILLGMGPSAEAWSIIGKYYCRKLILPFSTAIKFNSFSSSERILFTFPPLHTGLIACLSLHKYCAYCHITVTSYAQNFF